MIDILSKIENSSSHSGYLKIYDFDPTMNVAKERLNVERSGDWSAKLHTKDLSHVQNERP